METKTKPGPEFGRRRARPVPRGRQVDERALAEVRELLGDRPRRRDLLIEHLHRLQDRFGHLSTRHLAALAHEMRLSQAEVFEVATFYAHFDVVREGEQPPPPVTVRVCTSLPCAMAGAGRLLRELQANLDPERVRVVEAPCMGACDRAPACLVNRRPQAPADFEAIQRIVQGGEFAPDLPAANGLRAYRNMGGYELLARVRQGDLPAERVIGVLSDAGLRGMGGAGFPTGRKWSIVRAQPAPKYVAVNADEGEPGTFKDRHLLSTDPHRMLEGALIAAEVVGAERIYVYLRDEYPELHALLRHELAALEEAGIAAPGAIELRRGAGAYICGEESAMIESIEGKRGLPRHRPPYVASVGIFGRPTLVNNVETLWWVRDILEKGPDWFAAQGRRGHKGLRHFSVSGRVRRPGVKLAPAGITLRELVDEYCGGMADGHELRAFLPGGASGGILPASLADVPLDFGTLEPYGAFVGSHAVIVLSQHDDLVAAALNLMRFFAHESCGQCTPCRVGTEKTVALLESRRLDGALLGDLVRVMRDASICGLGQAAGNPVESLFRHFAGELGLEGGAS
ncbi:NADH-quinone oxidoreductase subunit F [bacterium HR39]|nr:NADH-quinone oxidoreductase subunit F [bacterium HR39]